MTKRYIFADESGDFTFTRGHNISKHFIVCTITMDACDCGQSLLELRRELVWEGLDVGNFFHATTDSKEVRQRVFQMIGRHDFRVQATILEKSKAQPQVRSSDDRFYKYGWLYHFKHALAKHVEKTDELLITTASVGTKKGQKVFTDAVNDVVQQHVPRKQWATYFCQSMADPCLQIADYCTWAVQRKWERGDTAAYDLIKDRISHEFELWRVGKTHYY